MAYFTTMNLPAPTHERFLDKLIQYRKDPRAAEDDLNTALERFFKVPKAITWTNCFTAIALTLMHASRQRKGRVAVSGLAYRRTADIVMWAGLQPIFVDNSPTDLSMDLDALRDTLCHHEVSCILMQHPMVRIANVDAFCALADEFAIPIIFDSVEATGGYFHGERIGKFGFAEAFSLHPSKVINAAEGGVLTFGSRENFASFRNSMEEFGVICRNSGRQLLFGIEPVHAIMGLASLEIYDEVTERHRKQYQQYLTGFRNLQSIAIVPYEEEFTPNYKSILIKVLSDAPGYREKLMNHLETHGIGARRYYSPLHSMTRDCFLPNARALAEKYLILPIGQSVTLADIESICNIIRLFESGESGG